MKQSTKRFFSAILSLILIAGAFFIYFDFIQPAYTNAQAVDSEVLSKENFITAEQRAVKQVQSLISAYQSQGDIQQSVSLAFPIGDDVVGAIGQLSGLANAANLSLQALTVSAEQTQPGVALTDQADASSLQRPLGAVIFTLKMTGSYESLKMFLGKLETNIRVFDVRNMDVQGLAAAPNSKQPLDLYNFNLQVSSYYQAP